MVSGESGVSTISIHAPTRGATIMDMSVPSIRTNFNPRSHKGSDDNSSDRAWFVSSISIHAPTRGATTGNGSITFYCYISIHAPTRGATMEFYGNEDSRRFQSTLPQGERQQFYTKFHICFISFLPILSPYHISTHSPLPTFNHFLYIFSGANRPEISCLLPFRTKTISGIL